MNGAEASLDSSNKDDTHALTYWKIKYTQAKLLFRNMHHLKSLETLQGLQSFIASMGPESALKTSGQYSAGVEKKLARIYCECLCLRKAYEHSEKAVNDVKKESTKPELVFKYRLAHVLTKRRFGDYIEALDDLN